LLGAGIGAAAIFPGLWLYNVYSYPYSRPWTFHNSTTNANETKPVNCLCEEYQECGCDDNSNSTFQSSLLGDGSYSSLNKSLVTVGDVNGTSTILINGTLPNGTTASGGTESASDAGSLSQTLLNASGYWVMAAAVASTIFLV